MDKDFAGKDSFIWFTGIVESKNDPLKINRFKVRIVGWHSDNKLSAPTDSLPWATSLNDIVVREGNHVFGFFLDGDSAQHPVILGKFPSIPLSAPNPQKAFNDNRTADELKNSPRPPQEKIYKSDGSGISIVEAPTASHYPLNLDEPTTPRMARNDPETINDTFVQERKNNLVEGVPSVNSNWSEPITKYNTKYPFNKVKETESGHIKEYDDTPGYERIQEAHRSGTFYEIFPDGSKVEKIVKDNYQIILKDDHVYIMGKCFITVQNDAEIYVKRDAFMKVDGDFNIKSGQNFNIEVGSNYTVKTAGSFIMTTGSNYTISSGGSLSINSSGNMDLKAPRLDLN